MPPTQCSVGCHSKSAGMDDEMLKRNTDCVFFLASPLTCKKGMECEYRHSEIARLNPRDCWYWLAGNCLNPVCGFRHPPLDLQNEAAPKSTISSDQSSPTVKKNSVPCYFYYSSVCNKGDSCSFSHGPDRFTPPAGKSLKDKSAVTRGPSSKDGAPARNAIGCNPRERNLSLSRTFPKAAAQTEPASDNVVKLSELSEISVAEVEVAPVKRSLFTAGLTLQRPHSSTHRSLVENVVTEDRWKAPPDFHVCVDGDNTENLYYKDDQAEYSPPYVQHAGEPNSPSSGYEFEEATEYDPAHPHADIFCKYGVYDTWEELESARSLNNAGTVQDEFSVRVEDISSSGGRGLLHMELEVGDCHNVVDLRDCLTRHRGNEDDSASWLLGRHRTSHSNGYRHTRLGRNEFSQRLQKRLTAYVGKNSAGSLRDYRFSLDCARKHDPFRRSRLQSFRKHKGKRQLYATRASRYAFSRGCRFNREGSAAFAGPRVQLTREDSAGCSSIHSSVDFQGPKPLSELLKNKSG